MSGSVKQVQKDIFFLRYLEELKPEERSTDQLGMLVGAMRDATVKIKIELEGRLERAQTLPSVPGMEVN